MDLGDQVAFNTVVAKEVGHNGTKIVATRDIPSTVGIVIGKTRVYDVIPGDPPTLIHPQPVYVVGVSLTQKYLVFQGDLTMLMPPNGNTNPAPVQPGNDLSTWVSDELVRKVDGKETFTAYDVTLQVRKDHPHENVPHGDVRPIVHFLMDNYIGTGEYEAGLDDFNGRPAFVYKPV